MYVLMKILLKFFEAIIKCVKGRAGIIGRSEIATQLLNLRQQCSCRIVLLGHHLDGVCNRSEASVRLAASSRQSALKVCDVGKQNQFLFGKVLRQLRIQLRYRGMNLGHFGVSGPMPRDYLLRPACSGVVALASHTRDAWK